MTTTDKTLWDSAPVVQTAIGTLWLRQLDGRYRHYFHHGNTRTREELAPLNPKPVELHPATTPEPEPGGRMNANYNCVCGHGRDEHAKPPVPVSYCTACGVNGYERPQCLMFTTPAVAEARKAEAEARERYREALAKWDSDDETRVGEMRAPALALLSAIDATLRAEREAK